MDFILYVLKLNAQLKQAATDPNATSPIYFMPIKGQIEVHCDRSPVHFIPRKGCSAFQCNLFLEVNLSSVCDNPSSLKACCYSSFIYLELNLRKKGLAKYLTTNEVFLQCIYHSTSGEKEQPICIQLVTNLTNNFTRQIVPSTVTVG